MSTPTQDDLQFFRTRLQQWAAEHPRPLPWKGIRDPYRIWLSEILLQQTRVEQGLPYYNKFVAAFPTVQDLANAPDEVVMRLWEGLGYYARARNLLATARHIAHDRGGEWPQDFDGFRALQGVGDYTAAAIASFAYDLPHAVLDGNVFRVLSRWWGIHTPTDTTAGKQQFAALAQQALDSAHPAAHNQAMMDFGATHCTPATPACGTCPMAERCLAFQHKEVHELPIKSKKIAKKDRFFLFLTLKYADRTFLHKRAERDIWQDLYQFPGIELDHMPSETDLAPALAAHFSEDTLRQPKWAAVLASARFSKPYKQALTHRVVKAVFAELEVPDEADFSDNWVSTPLSDPQLAWPVPRLIDLYWQDRFVTSKQGLLF
jgi:A/G-specific adenine glycosylase